MTDTIVKKCCLRPFDVESIKWRMEAVTIEAIKWTGKNWDEVKAFAPDAKTLKNNTADIWVITRNGGRIVPPGVYVVKDADGEIHTCEPGIFETMDEHECLERFAGRRFDDFVLIIAALKDSRDRWHCHRESWNTTIPEKQWANKIIDRLDCLIEKVGNLPA